MESIPTTAFCNLSFSWTASSLSNVKSSFSEIMESSKAIIFTQNENDVNSS